MRSLRPALFDHVTDVQLVTEPSSAQRRSRRTKCCHKNITACARWWAKALRLRGIRGQPRAGGMARQKKQVNGSAALNVLLILVAVVTVTAISTPSALARNVSHAQVLSFLRYELVQSVGSRLLEPNGILCITISEPQFKSSRSFMMVPDLLILCLTSRIMFKDRSRWLIIHA